MKKLLTIIIFFTTLISSGQSIYDSKLISNKTKKAVKKIEKVNELMSSAVGAAGMRPKQWDNFEELKKSATKEELIELTNHPNGVVRSYSFWALSHKKDIDLFQIVKNHINDSELISTQFGCIGSQEMVGDFFIQIMTPQYVDLDSDKMESKEMAELDSLLIYKPNKLSSRYSAIANAEPTDRLYPKIRKLVIKENNQSALVTLAKYQNEQDIELIINNRDVNDEDKESGFYFTYIAMQEFPRPEYLPILESHLKRTLDDTHFSQEWRELYKAIASFKNEKALELLKLPFTEVQHQNIKKYHIDFVFDAILEYQNKLYDDLLWRIWEEENQRTLRSYKYLLSLNPSRTYELTKKELIKNYKIGKSDFIPNLEKVEESENFYEYLLNVVIANDKELANKMIKEQIENSNVHNLPLFTSKVNRQKIFIEPLFNRLENAWNAHIYLDLVKTLIEFDDNSINKRILEVRKRNSNLNEDWGGKALDKLLVENGIE
jgi:hypothetical protein